MRQILAACAALLWVGCAHAQVDLDRYLKQDTYGEVKLSPTGEYYALTMNYPDRSVLLIQRRSDGKVTAKAAGGANSQVDDFWWVNDHRVVISMAEKFGSLEKPLATGELHAVDADGSNPKRLIGSVRDDGPINAEVLDVTGTDLQYAELIDTMRKDPQHVLVAISNYALEPVTRVARMDVDNGRLAEVARAPLKRASFATDADGRVRFAEGKDRGNASHLLYRDHDKADWREINDENATHRIEWPLGFSADGAIAYLQVQQASGPDAIVAFEPASGKRTQVLRDKLVDPDFVIYSKDGLGPVGASFVADQRSNRFFDEDGEDALLHRTLEAAFPGHSVTVTSRTADGTHALVAVSSDTNPGDFYLYDTRDQSAKGVFSRRLWLDPAKMAPSKHVEVAARDGLKLHAYLTLPKAGGTNLPMVVLPHGGPFGYADLWDFDTEAQLLADAGYAVLRVNFRGSSNYGRAFMHAGAREWGGRMQDDVTDATKWAVAQGVADAKRICIYGASYGAYAAMMGLAREPGLYRCGVGYVGVYDLPQMYREDARPASFMQNYFEGWIGEKASLEAISPTTLAAKITQPVFLAAGGKDRNAPIVHTKRMEKALKAAGNAPLTLYYDTEGHGFFTEAHQREFYAKLLDFLATNIGGARAK